MAIIVIFFLRRSNSSGVIGFFVFAWCLLTLSDNKSLRTGKNNTSPKTKEVIPYQIATAYSPKKGTPDSGQKPDVTESR
jgi:hypothetical protein